MLVLNMLIICNHTNQGDTYNFLTSHALTVSSYNAEFNNFLLITINMQSDKLILTFMFSMRKLL